MATTIFRTAHSTVVRDGMDFSAALCNADGETVAQAVTVPFHLGSVPHAMETLRAKWGDRMHPGDVFVMNDPFDGGIHLQDIFVFKPVFLDDELIGFATTTAHHGDVGGRLPGSAACDNTEIFQEGIRLPWLKLFDRGEPVEVIFEVIRANVRIPRMTLGDLSAQIAATSVAERELQELARRYGAERLADLMTGLIEHTERLVRAEIAGWPDGTATFTDYLDSDGIERRDVPITATVTIAGDEITADLTESAPMVAGALNSTRSFIQACVYQAVRSALEVEIPNTSGAFRPIHVLTKPGTIAHVVMPGASSMRGVTGFRALDAVNGALAQLIPDRVPAAGEGGNTLAVFGAERTDGSRFIFYELVVGTWGGTPEDDGNDGITNPASLAANIPVEVAESEFPIVIERYGLVPDSGGAGKHRGGLAVERVWRCLTPDTSLIVRSDRAAHPPYGLQGGQPGALSSNLLIHADGTEEVLPSMFSTTIQPGDVYVHRTAGGGGWGDPAERDPRSTRPISPMGRSARDRRDHVRGDPQRARRRDGRDGARAAQERVLDEHQDARRLLVRLLRRRAARRRAGLHAAGAPRLDGRADAARDPRLRPGEPRPGRRDHHERPVPERRAPERRLADLGRCTTRASCSATSRTSRTTSTSAAARPASIGAFREVFQEGVIIPPVKVVEGGVIVDDVFRLILAQIRSKHETAGDFRAQIAANMTGARRLQALADRHGRATIVETMRELLDYTERRTRAEIAALPHGVYEAEGSVDTDGYTDEPVALKARVEISAPGVRFDLAGSDAQRRAPVNSTYAQTFSACAYAVKCLIDPDLPGQRRLLPARLGRRAEGHRHELHLARTRRRRLGDADAARRRDLRRPPPRVPRAAARGDEGDDVPRGLRRRRRADERVLLLPRDVRRRLRRPLRERRARRRADARPEHRERARRGDRAELPGARHAARARRGLRRRRAAFAAGSGCARTSSSTARRPSPCSPTARCAARRARSAARTARRPSTC